MSVFSVLAESRIREWLKRRAEGKTEAPPPEAGNGESYEAHMVREIRDLRGRPGDEAAAGKARDLELQLLISLERNGFPLLARQVSDALHATEDSVSDEGN